MSDIFISYSKHDINKATIIVDYLINDNFSVWWDQLIKPGSSFDNEISKFLRR